MTTAPDESTSTTSGRPYAVLSTVLFLIGIGAFGTASSGDVTMFGITMEAKYACGIFFFLGAAGGPSDLRAEQGGTSFPRWCTCVVAPSQDGRLGVGSIASRGRTSGPTGRPWTSAA